MRACSVYNGLILCRRHCFTIVAHNWKFWQMYFAWNIVLKLYMCICIVLWMYFLILTPELSVIFCHLVCYTVSLKTFQGPRLHWFRQPLLLLYCMSYSLCIHLKEQLCGWNKHEFCLAKCSFIYLNRHDGFQAKGLLPPTHRPSTFPRTN